MELETRKVQKLGYSSLGVSLPKDWASSNGIRPGALVSLAIEDDGSLRVRVGPLEEYPVAAEATIDADDHRELHRRLQHDPAAESRGALPEPVAGNSRGGARPHRPHDREPGPQVRHDRKLRRADEVPH